MRSLIYRQVRMKKTECGQGFIQNFRIASYNMRSPIYRQVRMKNTKSVAKESSKILELQAQASYSSWK